MSLEGLLRELDKTKSHEHEKNLALVREQYDAIIRTKEEEIASLKEEIATLRSWLDHSALPAFNPISRREDSMGLIKLNFGEDKPCPDMWSPGEKEMVESIQPRKEEPAESQEDIFSFSRESLTLPEPVVQDVEEVAELPEPPAPKPELPLGEPETEPEPAPSLDDAPEGMGMDGSPVDVKIPSPKRASLKRPKEGKTPKKRASKPTQKGAPSSKSSGPSKEDKKAQASKRKK